MKLKDRLTKEDYRTIIIIVVILLGVVIAASTASCTTNNHPDINRHSLIFEVGSDSTYQFADHRRDSLSFGNRTVPNGYTFADGTSYSFTLDGNYVEVEVNRTPSAVRYYSKGTDSKAEFLDTGGTFSKHMHKYGHFIVEYNWID